MSAGYVELHVKSFYSFGAGASHVHELLAQAVEYGYGALALTDANLCGALEFARLAGSLGIRPITGGELTLNGGARLTLLAPHSILKEFYSSTPSRSLNGAAKNRKLRRGQIITLIGKGTQLERLRKKSWPASRYSQIAPTELRGPSNRPAKPYPSQIPKRSRSQVVRTTNVTGSNARERREIHRRAQQEKRQKAKAFGMCRNCNNKAIPDQTRCDTCAERHRVSRRRNDADRRAKKKADQDPNK